MQMHSLFSDFFQEEEIMSHRTIVEDYAEKIKQVGTYNRYPDISNRKMWEALPGELKKQLIAEGERALKKPWTQLLITDFMEFSKSGNRVRFEDKYFPRRRKLNSLVMAECVENKGRFTDAILEGLYLILEETTWCLPPHTSYVRDGKQENMPDVTRPIIDLFDGESGAEVAFCEYLLRPVFQKISPYISTYVNERLKERIFTPYLTQHFWWMGNGREPMCNWTPWCTQNVLICAFTREKDFFTESERLEFFRKAAASLDYFLDEYGEDGGCDEGAQYYSHAALCLFDSLELMNGVYSEQGKGGFDQVFREKLIKNIAEYIVKMHVAKDYYINFADCSAKPGRRTAREFLFGKAVGSDVLSEFAAQDVMDAPVKDRLITDEINLFYHVQQAFAMKDILAWKPKGFIPEDSYFASVGLMVARDKTYTLAAKAGDNADSHNHNDVGSFTIYKKGKPLIIDLGVGTYTARTFSDRRYELWTMQSQFHNLPTFIDVKKDQLDAAIAVLGKDSAADYANKNIIMEKDGENYAASQVTCLLCQNANEGISSLKMGIAGAYDSKQVKSYVRTISLNKGRNITVADEYNGTIAGVMSLMVYEKPEISRNPDGSIRISIGKLGTCTVNGAQDVLVQEYPITDKRLKLAWKHEVYRIFIQIKPDSHFTMIFE